ncbi:hypothetical protein GCM10017673_04740 [Streptosporangium violaceochromogenes]|nr:hypothetical protein GCM10017673_04740 [Streptosporangium violaceochromogenes]
MSVVKRLLGAGAGAVAVSAVMFSGSQAWAYSAYSGDDYAITVNRDRQVRVCDNTSNRKEVKVEYYRLSGARGNKWNRGDRGCSETGAGTAVRAMRVCEQAPGPDRCGEWATKNR